METGEDDILQTIIRSYSENPRDVATTPQVNRTPLWFYVSSDGTNVFVESGRSHANKAKITARRRLDKQNSSIIYLMYNLYRRGYMRRSEIAAKNKNSSYWFGIFEDLHF